MAEFSLVRVETSHKKVEFYYLLRNGQNPYLEFEKKLSKEKQTDRQLKKIMGYVELLSQGIKLPPKINKALSGRKRDDPFVDYEISYQKIRLYYFEDIESRRIIISGFFKDGKKTSQNKSISHMREIKSEYLKYIEDESE